MADGAPSEAGAPLQDGGPPAAAETRLPSPPGEAEEDELAWIDKHLDGLPVSQLYPQLRAEAARILREDWFRRFPRHLWRKLTKLTHGPVPRVLKELNETAPVIERTRAFVERQFGNNVLQKEEPRFTVVDLGCGIGFLSMFLAELLPPDKVKEIYLVDRMWPTHGVESTLTDGFHMSREHIDLGGYAIPLTPIKLNLKKGRDLVDLCHFVFQNGTKAQRGSGNRLEDAAPSKAGRIILLGVHLCGSLSLRAADLINRNPMSVEFACIKPCCLPGKQHLRQEMTYQVGGHSFTAEELYYPAEGGERRPLHYAQAKAELTDSEEEAEANEEANCANWDREKGDAPAKPAKKSALGARSEAAGDGKAAAPMRTGRGKLRFQVWCEQVYRCLEVPGGGKENAADEAWSNEGCRKSHEVIKVQTQYFQNRFLFYERQPRESNAATMNEGLTARPDGALRNALLQAKHEKKGADGKGKGVVRKQIAEEVKDRDAAKPAA